MRNVPKLRFKEFTDEWEENKLEELTKIITKQTGFDYSATIKPSLVNERTDDSIPFIQNKDFKGKYINYNTDFYIPKNIQKKFPKITLDEKCILITISGNIGNVGLFDYNELSFIGGAVGVIKLKDISILDYLFYYLISDKCQKKIISNEKTSAHKNITVEDIRKLIIKLPSSKEQEKIGNFLSSVDKKISIGEEKLNLFKEYKKGIMQKIFKQELRFKDENGNNYPQWEEKRLGEIINYISSGKTLVKSETGKYNLYGSTGKIGFTNKADYKGENILIARVGANAGTLNFINEECGITDNTLVTSIKNNNSNKWLYYYLTYYNLNRLIFGSGQPLITGSLLKNLKINLPCLEEQQKIADFLSAIDDKIENISDNLKNLKEFKKGLLQQMFV